MSRNRDPLSFADTIIDQNHRMIHDGFMFWSGAEDATLANGADLDILLTPGSGAHLQEVHFSTDGGPVIIELFEGATYSAAGSALTRINRNRFSSSTAVLGVTVGPTITDAGTSLLRRRVPATKQAPLFSQSDGGEIILHSTRTYLLRLNNASGQIRDVDLGIGWYELDYATL